MEAVARSIEMPRVLDGDAVVILVDPWRGDLAAKDLAKDRVLRWVGWRRQTLLLVRGFWLSRRGWGIVSGWTRWSDGTGREARVLAMVAMKIDGR